MRKWLPKFNGIDAIGVEEHMSSFWSFFQLHPIADDAEDLVMKLFSATLYDAARCWYTQACLMEALKPWTNLKKFSLKGGASKKIQICCLLVYMGLSSVRMRQ